MYNFYSTAQCAFCKFAIKALFVNYLSYDFGKQNYRTMFVFNFFFWSQTFQRPKMTCIDKRPSHKTTYWQIPPYCCAALILVSVGFIPLPL